MQTIACWSALPVSFTIGPKYVDFALVVSKNRLNDIGGYKTSRTVLIIQVDFSLFQQLETVSITIHQAAVKPAACAKPLMLSTLGRDGGIYALRREEG